MKTIKINKNDTEIRLDRWLKKVLPNKTMSFIYQALRTNKIKVNGKKTKFDYKLQENDVVVFYFEFENKADDISFLNCKCKIDIVYEDKNLLIVNKPTNLLISDLEKNKSETLINCAKKYLYETGQWDYKKENIFSPYLLHRLDYNTMGLVMVAKNHNTLTFLNEKIRNREVDKSYICAVHGKLIKNECLLEAFWFKDSKKNQVYISSQPAPNKSIIKTQYKVLNYNKKQDISILSVKLVTGKTHQIRAHFNFIGHPLVGEKKYISKEFSDNKKHQILLSYKIFFNFKQSGEFEYLSNKTIELKNAIKKIENLLN